MSQISNLLKNSFYKDESKAYAPLHKFSTVNWTSEKVGFEYQTPDYAYEYRVEIKIGNKLILSSKENITEAKMDMVREINEAIFGEFRPLLYKLKTASYEMDRELLNTIIADIHNRMFEL
jgi:hypothetical protein